MKGLLIKDFCIIAKNKKLFGILLFVVVFMFLAQGEGGASFVIAYTTILCGSFVLTTISTDEFDKSTTFLMTMPIKPSTYALEKYAFSFGCSLIGWLVSTGACCLFVGDGALELIKAALVMYVVLALFQLVMIPVQLKFGGENGRMVMMGMIVVVFAVVYAIEKLAETMFASEDAITLWIQGMVQAFETMKILPVAIAFVIGFVVCFMISAGISMKVMEKKEF